MNSDRGEPQTYEVVWMSGHVETLRAHQVSWPYASASLFSIGGSPEPQFVRFHAEIDGRWTLVLQAREADISSVRNVTSDEVPR